MKSNVILKGFFAKVVLVPLWNGKPNQFIQKYYPITLAAADSTCLENVNTRKCEVIWSQTENWKLIYLNKEGHKDTLHLLTRQPVIISEGKKHWSFCENRGNKVILKPWSSPVKCTITPCYTISLSKRSSKPTTTQPRFLFRSLTHRDALSSILLPASTPLLFLLSACALCTDNEF